MGIKLQDIAKELNISTATVSRALNSDTKDLVKQVTRDKIFEYIKRTGYKPNIRARSLASGKLSGIYFVLSMKNFDSIFYDQYFFKIIKEILGVIKESQGPFALLPSGVKRSQYSFSILPIESSYTPEQIYELLLNSDTAGLILSSYCSDVSFPVDIIKSFHFPVITLDMDPAPENAYNIRLNHKDAGYKGAQFLWKKGYRNFMLVSDINHSHHSELRKQGFYSFFENINFTDFKITNIELPLTSSSSIGVIDKLRELNVFPTGVFVLSDEIATGVINRLRDAGLKCPEDVGVLGFDGLPIGQYVLPALQSVAFPIKEMGKTAALTILSLLEGKSVSKDISFDAYITDGQSC
ncbi:MAG: LacI family DNA-binding transcriptional regulator [Candidatus Omnitrophica bacterium]|nr:LacI family DNA-binding transcriptional regulator [Candidatus Omnitrophota bacterium]